MEIRKEIDDHITPNMMIYSMSTITDRALPDVADGLKPVHRRILYAMYNAGYSSNKEYVKTVNPISETMKIHGHGDSSIEGAIALLTDKNETLLHPYIEGEGSFGKVYNTDKPSAPRYTFCRLNSFVEECFLKGLSKNIVDFVTESGHKQPVLLPNIFPNILIKPNQGIAVGMATNIPSFNLAEVLDFAISVLQNDDANIEYLVPDFSSGGECLFNMADLKNIYDTGVGKITIRSKWIFNEADSCIEVYEIPFSTTTSAIIDKVTSLIKEGKLRDVLDIRDETGYDFKFKKEVLKIAIDIKGKSDPNVIMNKLFAMTPLKDNFNVNMNMLVNGEPKTLGVKQTINEWIKFRKTCLRRELEYDINKLEEECNKLMGLETILSDLDEAIPIIRGSKSESEAMNKLQSYFKLNQPQVEYICTIRLMNMNNEWLHNKISKLGEITNQLHKMRNNISSDDYYTQTIISQLTEVKNKYGQPRRTTIIHEEETTIPNDILIENYNCQTVLTEQGYLKKTLRYSDTQKVKDGDTVIQQIPSTNKSKLLFFTDKANCYYLNAYDIETTQPSNLGNYLPTMLQLQDEKILYTISTEDFKGFVLFAFENGKVAKINLSSYETKTNRTKVINTYNTDSKLVSINAIEKDCDFMAISSIDKVLVVNTELINPKDAKSSQGVNVLRSKKDSYMIEFKPCGMDEEVKEYYRVSNTPATGKYSRKDF